MTRPKLVAHCLVRNEELWIWYAIMSVIDQVDEILIWDTGSTDNTVSIIKSISSPKIKFKQLAVTLDETSLSQARTAMLNETESDWLLVLDGDEVWPDDSLITIKHLISNNPDLESLVVPTLNCLGDVFHISPPSAGKYHLAGRVGHLNLRFINLQAIPGLEVTNPPGQLQSYVDTSQTPIQNRNPNKIAFINAPYFHMTHLDRSSSRANDQAVYWRQAKRKYDFGISLPKDFAYPSCFYQVLPPGIRSPWQKRSPSFILNALWQTPLRDFKRLLT